MAAAAIRLVHVRLSPSPGVEMLVRWCVLCICIVQPQPSLAYYTDSETLFTAEESSSYSHQVWVRQTNEGEARTLLFQRPGRQLQQCRGPGGQRGHCVPVESCVLHDINMDYIKNKEYFCDLRNQGGIGVCCPDSVTSPVTYSEGISNQGSGTVRLTRSPQEAATTDGTSGEDAMHEAYPLGDYRVCGRSGKKLSKITSGSPTTVRDWPWMAAILHLRSLKQFCGGTVITRRHVLTAAHCFPKGDPSEIMLILGDYDLTKQDDSKSKFYTAKQIIVHEDYDVTNNENDIAIIVLNATTIYNSYIQPCCLPSPGAKYPNLTAVVTGWGETKHGGSSANILMEVPVPIWEQERCVPNFAQTIFDTNLCAGAYEGGKDSCKGDSGGPLVIQRNDGRWTIVGVVSWGIECGKKNNPGIYTRVNDYLDWISKTIL